MGVFQTMLKLAFFYTLTHSWSYLLKMILPFKFGSCTRNFQINTDISLHFRKENKRKARSIAHQRMNCWLNVWAGLWKCGSSVVRHMNNVAPVSNAAEVNNKTFMWINLPMAKSLWRCDLMLSPSAARSLCFHSCQVNQRDTSGFY